MVTRRTLLVGTAGLMASSLLVGCGRNPEALRVTLLEGAIPPEVLQSFRKQVETPVSFTTLPQIQGIFQALQRWQQMPEEVPPFWRQWLPGAQAAEIPLADNLVSLGDYWLKDAIAQNLIEPLVLPEEIWERLPVEWQQFVSRDDKGLVATSDSTELKLWAAPYKAQSLVIVYRQSQFPQSDAQSPFQSWRDLLAPELRQRIALPDHPNLGIGLLQKLETGSFNTSFSSRVNSSASIPQLVQSLSDELSVPFSQFNRQVKTYDAGNGLKSLINEDVDIVIAWSSDVITALRRYQDLRAVVPAEGSLLSTDLWVQPKGTTLSQAAKAWIAFCWTAGAATQLSVSGRGISPTFLGNESELPEALSQSLLVGDALKNSEPLLTLPEAMQSAYVSLWRQLRTNA